MSEKRKWKRLIKIILAVERAGKAVVVQASSGVYSSAAWTAARQGASPLVRRMSFLMIAGGAVDMAAGYARNGIDGIARGVFFIALGGVLYEACL